MLGWLSSSIGKTSRPFWTNTPLQYCPDAGKSVILPPQKTTQRNTSPLAGSSERQDTPLKKKIWFGFVVVYAFTQLADAAIHQFILDQDYKALADLWRPESELKLWFFPLLGLSFSFCFSLLFSKAYRGGGIPEGARYGFVVSMMIVLPQSFADYAVLSIPPHSCPRVVSSHLHRVHPCRLIACAGVRRAAGIRSPTTTSSRFRELRLPLPSSSPIFS